MPSAVAPNITSVLRDQNLLFPNESGRYCPAGRALETFSQRRPAQTGLAMIAIPDDFYEEYDLD